MSKITEYRITEVGLLLLHPLVYATEKEAIDAAAEHSAASSAAYQAVTLIYDDPMPLLEANAAKAMAAKVAQMDAETLGLRLVEARALIAAGEAKQAEEAKAVSSADVGSAASVLKG